LRQRQRNEKEREIWEFRNMNMALAAPLSCRKFVIIYSILPPAYAIVTPYQFSPILKWTISAG